MRLERFAVSIVPGPVIPRPLAPGVLYLSEDTLLVLFLCPCGCLREIPIPCNPHQNGWNVVRNGDRITINPSIRDNGCPEKSHYNITDSRVVWHAN